MGALGVVSLLGPQAWRVLAARFETSDIGPLVDLDRVEFVRRPTWLTGPLQLLVAKDLSPRLRGRLGLLDEAAAVQLKQELARSHWVERVDLQRSYPDRYSCALQLRQPVLEVRDPRRTSVAARLLVDRHGRCLTWMAKDADSGLPQTTLIHGAWQPTDARSLHQPIALGQLHPDPRVLQAAKVVLEWPELLAQEPLAALAAAGTLPPLVEVDTTNLKYHYLGPGIEPEVRVGLRASDGRTVFMAYGRRIGSRLARVPLADKAAILAQVLAAHSSLLGVVAADLRFRNHWRRYLHLARR